MFTSNVSNQKILNGTIPIMQNLSISPINMLIFNLKSFNNSNINNNLLYFCRGSQAAADGREPVDQLTRENGKWTNL